MMLDVDHGTYPLCDLVEHGGGQAATGSGMGPRGVGYVLGITKAYTTRVGDGPFPTELARCGRPTSGRARPRIRRRDGQAAALRLVRRGARAPGGEGRGIDGIALTKLDVLDGFDEIKICVGYRIDGKAYDYLPAGAAAQARGRAGLRNDRGLDARARAAPAPGPICRRPRSNISAVLKSLSAPGRAALDQPRARGHDLVRDPFAD